MSSPYTGPLDRLKMTKTERFGYEAYNGQKARSKKAGLPPPQHNAREFIAWWKANIKSFSGTVPTCGRKDHSKGYSWDNIEMQDMPENSREGIIRNKRNIIETFKGKKIGIFCKKTGSHIATASSIRDVAKIFGISQRLVQFLIRRKYKSSKKLNFALKEIQ